MKSDDMAGFFLDGWYVFDNFAPFEIEWQEKNYPTSEHAYQAAHFFDTTPEIAELVRLQKSPRLASDVATMHADKEDPDWSSKKVFIMESILRAKLEQHDLVKETLIKSGARKIVEMNDNDEFWGWGAGPEHAGQNELGRLWMKLRSELTGEK
jgi:ribA/ribD-fused uncharacterized protein